MHAQVQMQMREPLSHAPCLDVRALRTAEGRDGKDAQHAVLDPVVHADGVDLLERDRSVIE